MSINLRDTGTEIGSACSWVLVLSSTTFVASLVAIALNAANKPAYEANHRVAKMSVILMGASSTGCILGAWMTGAIGKEDDQEKTKTREQVTTEFILVEKQKWAPVEARDREIRRRGQQIRELHQQLEAAQEKIENWQDWWETCQSLDAKYDVFGCKGCRFFDGSDDGGNFFICAMHPYGQRNCEDKENE